MYNIFYFIIIIFSLIVKKISLPVFFFFSRRGRFPGIARVARPDIRGFGWEGSLKNIKLEIYDGALVMKRRIFFLNGLYFVEIGFFSITPQLKAICPHRLN